MENVKLKFTSLLGKNPGRRVPLLIVGVTLVAIILIFSTRPKIEKRSPEIYIPVVHTITAKPGKVQIPIHARGFVEAEQEVQLSSRVSGTVTEITSKFAVGASFRKGDLLMRVDTTQLQMDYTRAKASYEQARLSEMELNANLEARSALNEDPSARSELASGKHHRSVAHANTEAALAALKMAESQLEGADLRAPFDGKVMLRLINEFELLAPGKPIAKLYSTESFIVKLPVTEEQLALINLQGEDGKGAVVKLSNPATGMEWPGRIVRSEGFISPSRLIYLIARVDTSGNRARVPLSGTLLEAIITGKTHTDTLALPVKALKPENRIWIATPENRLESRPITLVYRGPEIVYLQAAIAEGDRIITSHITSVTEGMPLRVADGKP